MHPDLAAVLTESRRIWRDSKLRIISNGLLIHQAKQEVFDALKKGEYRVIVSDHSCMGLSFDKVAAGCARLKEEGVDFYLRLSNGKWRVQHQWSESGEPIPFQSSPQDAWSHCHSKSCPAIAGNHLYKCNVLSSIIGGVGDGSLPSSHWKDALTYTPLSPDADAAQILEHFRTTQEVKECCICPAERIFTQASQIEHIPHFRKAV